MPWGKVDDGLHEDPDLDYISPEAVCLFFCAMSWCSMHLTDGFVPEARLPKLHGYSARAVEDLLTSCAPGNLPWMTRVEGGFYMRSYLKFNPPADDLRAQKEHRSQVARENANKRWQKSQECEPDTNSNASCTADNASGNANGNANGADLHSILDAPYSRIPVYPNTPISHSSKKEEKSKNSEIEKPPDGDRHAFFWPKIRELYPKRSGTVKMDHGEKIFKRLLFEDGFDPAEVLAGVQRYRKWADALGKTGTSFISTVPKFLEELQYRDDWEIPPELLPGADGERPPEVIVMLGGVCYQVPRSIAEPDREAWIKKHLLEESA